LKIANFNLPYLFLALSLGVTVLEFCRDLWRPITIVPGLSYSIFCMSYI